MARRINKVICVTLVVILSMCSVSCDSRSADEILDSAALSFADGKPTESIDLPDTEKSLNDMINQFSGSYYYPEEKELTDDEYIDLMRKLFDPDFDLTDETEPAETESTETEPTETDSTIETSGDESSEATAETTVETTTETTAATTQPDNNVSSMDDLKRVIHTAFDETATSVEFTYVDGFYVNLSDCLNDIYVDLQREDPLDVSGVAEWSWWYSGNDYTLFITYSYDVDEFIEMKATTEYQVQQVVSQIQPEGKTDYEIVCAVNEYLCDTVYYPESKPYEPVTHTAYGALYNGCAVCEGYACAAKLLLSACGVESDIEVGDCIEGGGHAWNLVKVDGVWYQLDVCWNDGCGDREMYFLVDDAYMLTSRTWDYDEYPVCGQMYVA